ncbi:ABC transporter permease [Acrocarpospora corrugata]|uniref:ABC transporter permease n=1 Tax=Acrocarpospora corrugata TaxID=35763 RepID=UPI002483864C
MVILSLIQPLIILILFSQVFNGVAGVDGFPPGIGYIDYLMPGIIVITGVGGALGSGIGLVDDLNNGVIGRLRALPISMISVLVARSLADLAGTAVQMLLLTAFGVAVFGFDPAGGIAGQAATTLLALFVSWSLTWIFLALAAWQRNAAFMQSLGFMAMFPLMFASSFFVPITTMPTWLQLVATANPLTHALDTARNLAFGHPTGSTIWAALGTSLVLLTIGMATAALVIRRAR